MSIPRVSVIMPCHNAAPWIAAAIESAILQDWPDVEVIVVDDGSTDESAEIARRYDDRRVRVFRQPRRGASAARNAALGHASGHYLQYLDADDLLGEGKIRTQVERLQAANGDFVASGAWARFSANPEEAEFRPLPNWRDMDAAEYLCLLYEEQSMIQPAAWLVPRSVAQRAGPWDESLSLNDDGDYFARIAFASSGILFCESARSYYRSAVGGLSSRRDPKALASLFRSVEKMTSLLLESDKSPRARAAAAHAWKWLAYELYPEDPVASRIAQQRSSDLGGSARALPQGPRQAQLSRLVGWRMAKRLSLRMRGLARATNR